jgi:hypothetical protein
MPFQSVPHGVGVYIIGSLAGQEVINDFYATKAGYDLTAVQALADVIDLWVSVEWLPILPSDFSYLRTEVRGLESAIDLQATSAAHAGVGELGGEAMPNNVTLSVARKSGFTGRGARGRIYFPAIEQAYVDQATNTVSSTLTDAILVALDAMNTAITAQGFVPVIVHRIAAGVPLVPAVVFTLVEWVIVDNVIDSMRRRLPKRGV